MAKKKKKRKGGGKANQGRPRGHAARHAQQPSVDRTSAPSSSSKALPPLAADNRNTSTPPAGLGGGPELGGLVRLLLSRTAAANRGWLLVGLAVLSGCMWFLSCADFDIWPMAWLAMVPGLIAIEAGATVRRGVLLGWLTGIVANVGGFYWITGLLARFGNLPGPVAVLGLLLLCAYQATVFLLFAWALRHVRARYRIGGRPIPMVIAAPVIMVAFEILVPFIFPWYLAITQAWITPIIQVAEITGPVGVTFLLMMVNGAIYDVISAPAEVPAARRIRPAVIAASVVAAALVFGFVRMDQIDDLRASAQSIDVGVVQGNIPFDEKGYKNPDLAPSQLEGLQRVSKELEDDGADLIVWSESSYPYSVPRAATTDFPGQSPFQVRRGFSSPLVFGAVTRSPNRRESAYNSALYLDKDGNFAGRFDKIFLLLFGEYIPFKDILEPILPENASHFNRGQGVTTFEMEHEGKTYRLGPMICYEDILPDFGRKLAALAPHLFVNITNDAWFGDTSEPWEHLALSVYRSVESRTDMIRAVNTGVSAHIDATGRVVDKSYAVDPHNKPAPVPMTGHLFQARLIEAGHTFYARFGNVFGWLCAGLTLLGWIILPLAARLRR